jgi:uncharacterized membrane protein YfcA
MRTGGWYAAYGGVAMPVTLLLMVASLVTAGLGAVGGLGGAILLVPLLALTGTAASEAAPLGLVSVAAGSVAGVAGASGGFLKTPVTAGLMGIPLKVAASTTTFTIGVTAAAGLVVFAVQGRIDPHAAAAVVAGSLIGGQVGARLQALAPIRLVRVALGMTLVVVAVLLWASSGS